MQKKRFEIINSIDELKLITGFINKLAKEGLLPEKLVNPINVALEEVITNIISYAFPKDPNQTHLIELVFTEGEGSVNFEIIDNGIEFDPITNAENPDISLGLEDRPIGGLGIFLIKKLMDVVEYSREKNKNHLFLSKHIGDI